MEAQEIDNWGDSWSTSDSDETGSSYSEESNSSLRMEAVRVGGERLLLPQGLCENPDVFREFLSLDTWNSFSESQQQYLKNFLPTFPERDEEEKDETLRMLFSRENIRFGNPLTEFHDHLKAAHYRPDVSKMRTLLRKAQYKDYKRAERWRVYELLKSVLSSRQRLVESVVNGEKPKVCPSPPKRPRTSLAQNVKYRYFQELALIREEVGESSQSSEDENYPEGPTSVLNKKQLQLRKQTVVGLLEATVNGNGEGSGTNNTFGGNETPMQLVLGTLCPGPNPWDPTSRLPNSNPYIAQEQPYIQMLASHAKRRANKEEHPDLQVDGITIHDVVQRCKVFKKQPNSKPIAAKKVKIKPSKPAQISNIMMEEDGEDASDLDDTSGLVSNFSSVSAIHRDLEEEGIDVESVDDLPPLPVVLRTVNSVRAASPKTSKSNIGLGNKRLTKGEPPPHSNMEHNLMTVLKKSTNEMASGPDSLTRRLSVDSDRSNTSSRVSTNRPRLVDSVQQTEHIISPRKVVARSISETSVSQQNTEPTVVTVRKVAGTSTLDHSWITNTSQISKPKEIGKDNWILKDNKFTKLIPEESPPQITVRASTPITVGRQNQSTSSTGTNTSSQQQPQQFSVVTPVKTVTSISTTRPLMTPATLSDLDGIDMMDLPVDFDESSPISLDDLKPAHPELMQETHACFFSLIRDILTSTPDHRIEMKELESRVKAWAASPIGPINQWYTPRLETRLTSAVQFLAGDLPDCVPDDYVPYMEWKANVGAYQWIGAGRDSDHRLVALCDIWLNPSLAKQQPKEVAVKPVTTTTGGGTSNLKISGNRTNNCGHVGTSTTSRSHHSRSESSRPPALKPSSPKDRELFRIQEKQRFETPYRAFTYSIGGIESIVGPVRSVQNSNQSNSGGQPSKARGHLILVDSRPKYVTILELVRDAVARLPNAQGTRADIVTLLKDSQYLATDAAESVLSSVVSGALDKLHCEHDPCVRFDTQKKLWVYLHKGRTAEEFERLHALGEDIRAVTPKARKKRPNKPKKEAVQSVEFTSAESAVIVTDSGQTLQQASQEATSGGVCVMSATGVGGPLLLQTKPKVQTQVRTNAASTATVATAAKKVLATTTEVGGAKSLLSSGTKTVSPQLLSRLQQQAAIVKRPLAVVTGGDAGQKTISTSTVTAAASLLPTRAILHDLVTTSRQQPQNIVKKVNQPQTISVATDGGVKQGTKSIVKVLTTQAATNTNRTVQRIPQGSQTTGQQVIHLKQQTLTGEPKLLQKATATIGGVMKKATAGTSTGHQQVIVMKQAVAGDQAGATAGQQMIVINQQPVVVDSQQLTAKQQKQLQQFLNKQQLEQQQQNTNAVATAAIQQQLQQLLLAKQQQQIVNDQQKTVVKVQQQPQQQQMIVVKQQGGNVTTSDGQIIKQSAGTVQQMILVKQASTSSANVGSDGDSNVVSGTIAGTTTTATQITQQQFQQMLLLKQQQQQQQQQQIIMVKQQDQKSVQVLTQQVPKSQAQQVTLAQLQQLQQQQQQRNAATTSLLTHPRVVAHVSSGTMSTVAGTSLIKPQNQTVGGSTSGCSGGNNNGVGGISGVGTSVVAKVVTSTQPVLTMESLLAHHKQQTITQQAGVRLPTVSRAGLTSQYAVVSLPQTRVVQTSLPQVVASTSSASGSVVAVSTVGADSAVSKITTAQGVRIPGLNLAQLGGKQLLLAASKPQATATIQGQNVLLGQATGGGTLLVGGAQQGTVTVLQQGSQQILIQPGTLKTLQGLKVIPLTQAKPQTLQAGRQQVFARIINPGSVRPVLAANIIQQQQQQPDPTTSTVTTSAQSPGQNTSVGTGKE